MKNLGPQFDQFAPMLSWYGKTTDFVNDFPFGALMFFHDYTIPKKCLSKQYSIPLFKSQRILPAALTWYFHCSFLISVLIVLRPMILFKINVFFIHPFLLPAFGRKVDSLQGVPTYFTILFILSVFHQKSWSFQKELHLFLTMSLVL